MVKIKVLGYLTEILGFIEREINLEKPTKLSNILKRYVNLDLENIIIIVNNRPAALDTIINENDKIVLMPIIGGGCFDDKRPANDLFRILRLTYIK